MLSAIREIGRWQINKFGKSELDVLIKEPKFKTGVFIKIDIEKNTFEGVEPEEYDTEKKHRYLFTGGVSQGPNPTPVANIPNVKKGKNEEEARKNLESRIRKTFEGKIQKWFDKYSDSSNENSDFLKSIRKILSDNEDNITYAIWACIKDLDRKEGKLLAIKIKENGEWKYIGDFEVFKKSLKEIENQKTIGISENDKNCSICGVRKALVSGDVNVFKFYTIDKPGFITGGFNENLAWRNFPVCPECKLELEEGKNFLEKFSFKFYGLNYFLIPRLLIGGKDIMEEILSVLSETTKAVSLKERCKKRLLSDEDFIMDYLSEKEDRLTIHILFLYRPPLSSAENILLHIEDIFPSRIREIFKSKDYVDKIFNEDFKFDKIRTFFSKSSEGKRENDLNKYFLEIVDSVFKGKGLDFSFLLKFYMTAIRKEFIKDRYFMPRVKDALMDTIYFENLGLISFGEVENMEESIFEDVFKKYGSTFASPVKRGLFLVGALTQMLLNKQAKERGAKPFMKKLKGLKMNEQDIKALLPAVQNKFEEYNSFGKGKKLVAEEAYNYLFASGDNWRLSVDEINFYFAGGMNLIRKIKDILYIKVEKDADLEEVIQLNEKVTE